MSEGSMGSEGRHTRIISGWAEGAGQSTVQAIHFDHFALPAIDWHRAAMSTRANERLEETRDALDGRGCNESMQRLEWGATRLPLPSSLVAFLFSF